MAVPRRPSRSRATLLFLVLVSMTLITLDSRGDGWGVAEGLRRAAADALAPVRSLVAAATAPAARAWDGLTRYDQVRRENAELRARLEEVEGARLRAEDAARERRALLALQDLGFAADVPAVAARVVSAPPSNVELTVEIDRGRAAGVGEDMPVVTGAGLVGRVAQVSGQRAVVRLLTDPGSSVGVRLAGSGDVGIAAGAGAGRPLPVGFLDPGTPVAPGDAVVTSGVSTSAYPASIPVGRVAAVREAAGRAERTVLVEPSVDLDRLEFVKVLQWTAAGPFAAGALSR